MTASSPNKLFLSPPRVLRAVNATCALVLLIVPLHTDARSAPESKGVPAAFTKAIPGSVADLSAMQKHVETLAQRLSPAVVAVRIGMSAGSGVVITEDGFVLSAAHVCGRPDQTVHLTFPDGRTAKGRTLGTNHDLDSGLIKITDEGKWPHVPMAEPGLTKVGDWVLALGHPGGFEAERKTVARLGRVIQLGEMLQTDCTLIAGDSGGPLFNMQGQVAGIHSRISEATSDNYHVPVDTYVSTWDRLAKGENWGGRDTAPNFATIGVRGVDDERGCLLQYVNENGPAYRAGLRPGDVITRVNFDVIDSAGSLVGLVRKQKPGDTIKVTIRRGETEQQFDVTVEQRRNRRGGWRTPP